MNLSYLEIIFAACLLILPFLYETSSAFRYNLKFFLYPVLVTSTCLLLIPYLVLHLFDVSNFVVASMFCHPVSTLFGIKWTLKGKEHLEKKQACIVVANHQSCLDVLGMFDIWHIMDKCTVVAKRELLYSGPFGLMAWLSGIVLIDRRQPAKAQVKLNETVENLKANNTKLWMFPEGTRRNTGKIHPFKKGAFHMAISAQIPILPVVYSSYYFLDSKKKRFDNGKIAITALPPISTQGLTKDDIEELMEKVHTTMSTVFDESNLEIKKSLSLTNKH